MDGKTALRSIKRLISRFGSEEATLADHQRLVREVTSILDDVNTQSDHEPAGPQSEAVTELLRLGVFYYACATCGKPVTACHCIPHRVGTLLAFDSAALSALATLPTD